MDLGSSRPAFGEKDEEQLELILTKAGLLNLKSNFVQEKVCVKLIQFLESKDWDRLGVSAIGDRIVLIQLSKAQTRDEVASKELRDVFGHCSSSSTCTPPSSSNESFASRAERLCGNILSKVGGGRNKSRLRKRSAPCHRVKEWTKNVVLIDCQGYKKYVPMPLYDYQKLFDGPIRILSDMSESDVREEIVRLVKLKSIPTHKLGSITAESFEFVKVFNRRVRPVDGDIPCDGTGLSHMYRSGCVYVRLKDTSLWVGDQNLMDTDDEAKLPSTSGNQSSGSERYSTPVPQSSSGSDRYSTPVPQSSSGSDRYSAFVNLISDSDSDEQSDLQQAIQESLQQQKRSSPDRNISLLDVLPDHISRNIFISSDIENLQRFPVRRSAVWKSALRCYRSPTFKSSGGINVVFLSEGAVDAGGPLRELFRLLLKNIDYNGSLMCGQEYHRTATHNGHALFHQEYKYIGWSVALSILYGGPGPHFFSDAAANYLLDLPIEKIPIVDIPDPEVIGKIEQLNSCETTDQLRKLLDSDEFEFRFDCGCSMASSSVTIDDRDYLSQCISMHYVIYSKKSELDQIKEGFELLNFKQLIEAHPRLLKPLFVREGRPKITACGFLDLFQIKFSCEGSNRRSREEEIILHWNYYVSELEGGHEFKRFDVGTITLDIEDLLCFITGADHIPPLGFNVTPQVEFTDDTGRILPTASTCSLTVYLSLHLVEYSDFVLKMDEAIVSSPGFGTV